VEFRILGPLEVLENGQTLDLGGQKQRALLAMLLMHANEVVSADGLIEALWEEAPPETAQKALQVYVSNLRKPLGKERLQTKASGYLLRVDEGELDVARFRQLQQAGKLVEALSLWRGPALADFRYQRFAQTESARLEELRLVCLEQRIERDLAEGRAGELVGELEVLLKQHPLRERLRAQLMLSLYRAARQAEALDVYQQGRRLLVEELGIEPSRELRDLHQRILNQDRALDATTVSADAVEPSRSVFVGRRQELAELCAGLEDAIASRGCLVLLRGEPGIGKSRLAEELIAQARARGAQVFVGRCWEAGGAPAYWPWVQSLRALVREAEPETLRGQLGLGAGDLAQLLPELRELFPGLPEPPALESDGARFRLFDAAASFLKSAARRRPLLLVLDDLHAADEPTLLLLRFLAREIGGSRLLVIGAYRDVDPTPGDPLAATVAELVREAGTRLVTLSGLREADVAEYVELATGATPDPCAVRAIHAETEGNPFFVAEVVRLLVAEGATGRPERPLGLPEGVREVVERRLRRLSGECQRVLTLCSVLGREFGTEQLMRFACLSQDELVAVLDEAMVEKIVSDAPGAPGGLRFAHVLFRDTLYDTLTTARRAELHRRAGESLEEAYGRDLESHLAELAHHFFAAAPTAGRDKAIDYARRAGDRALALLAYEEAARFFEMALTLPMAEIERCELLLRLGDAQGQAGDDVAAKETFLRAAAIAREASMSEQFARAALGYAGRDLWGPRGESVPRLVPLLEEAVAALGAADSSLKARVLAHLVSALRSAAPSRAASFARQAVEMGRRLGDVHTIIYAREARLSAIHDPGEPGDAVRDAEEVVRLAEEVGDWERAFGAYEHLLYTTWTLGKPDATARAYESMTTLASELHMAGMLWAPAAYRAMSALSQGRHAAAEQLIEENLRIGERSHSWHAVASSRIQTFGLRDQQGRLSEYIESLRGALEEDPSHTVVACSLAYACCGLARQAEAKRLLERIAGDDLRTLPRDDDWLASMCLIGDVCVRLEDVERADTAYQLLLPCGDLNAVAPSEISFGSVARYLGLLAVVLGRFEHARVHFDNALAMNERMGALPWLAHTQADLGRLLLKLGETERGVELIATALTTYRELGMETYAASMRVLAQAYA
jgi:DNA-binding SARP family transcriptional activator/tetratricopeptide (TPR) repeat protein